MNVIFRNQRKQFQKRNKSSSGRDRERDREGRQEREVGLKVERSDWRPTVPFESFKIFEKFGKIIAIFFENSEFGAVQRIANLVDLAKRCKMSIWLQKSALIQPRTSPLKFD